MMQERNRYFSFARQKGAPSSREGLVSGAAGSKHERFRYIVPLFQNRKIYFPEQLQNTVDMKEILKQLKGATQTGFSTHDDACDGISQLGLIDIIAGSGEMEDEKSIVTEDGLIWTGDWDDGDKEYSGGSTVF
jgi:hypothetical protein